MKIVKSRLCTSQYTERSLDFRFCALQKWSTSNKCCTKHTIMLIIIFIYQKRGLIQTIKAATTIQDINNYCG